MWNYCEASGIAKKINVCSIRKALVLLNLENLFYNENIGKYHKHNNKDPIWMNEEFESKIKSKK